MRGGMGRIGYLADGTAVALNAAGQITGPAPVGAQAVPSQAGGGNVQGRGLVFCYQTPNVASIANGVAQAVTIQFDQNSVFNWLRTTVTADIAGAVVTPSSFVEPLVTLQITDTGNGMSFMNAPIPVFSLAGSAQLPFVLPTPQFVQSNASYQFQWANYSAATTYANLRLQLWGYRIFNVGTAS